MAPIKLEENIREKLQEREIQPSNEAWAKLEGQLEDEKGGNKFMWYAIAASFIGIIIVASFVFNNDAKDLNKTLVKEDAVEKVKTEETKEVVDNTKEEIVPINTEEGVATEKPVKRTTESTEATLKKTEKQVQQQNGQKTEALAKTETDPNKDSQLQEINSDILINKSFETNQVEKVVAEVKALKDKNQNVNIDEIDALLKNAQREIRTQRILNNKQVDAMALLDDVEFEMEQGFREKVFMALGEGFDKLKTAVAERNN